MPYIKKEDRYILDPWIDALFNQLAQNNNVGEYNYVITKLVHDYIRQNGLRYKHINDVVGILDSVKAEFQRVVVAPYEDQKLISNGSVSSLDNTEEFLDSEKKE